MAGQYNPRSIVADILIAADRDGEFSHIAVRRALDKYSFLPRRDRAFIKRVSEGTIERTIEIDYITDQFSSMRTEKMKPLIRAVIRSAVYQIMYMDSVPDAAACSEAVKLAAGRGFSSLRGFVNGVLRSIIRHKDEIEWPSFETEPVRSLSVRYSMPEWITNRFARSYGYERCESILRAYLEKHLTCVRIDASRRTPDEFVKSLREQGISVIPHESLSYAFYIDGYDRPDSIPGFKEGIFYIQDVSSMMVAETADPAKGSFVLDVCAAPGGKSIHIAQMMAGTGMVEARDISEYKVGLIRENIKRCGAANMRAAVWDALLYDGAMERAADVVIADLPCSGLGVIGSKTDIKYRASEDKIRELAALQRNMLKTVKSYVKPGGALIYSTCTLTEEENQQNTEWFLNDNPQFRLESEQEYLPDEGCDGFYIAKMRLSADME